MHRSHARKGRAPTLRLTNRFVERLDGHTEFFPTRLTVGVSDSRRSSLRPMTAPHPGGVVFQSQTTTPLIKTSSRRISTRRVLGHALTAEPISPLLVVRRTHTFWVERDYDLVKAWRAQKLARLGNRWFAAPGCSRS
jgi:hypothetical protein